MRWVGGQIIFVFVHDPSERCPHRGGKVVKKANFCPRNYWMTPKKKVHISLRGWVICLHLIQNLHQGCMRSSSLSFRLRNLIFLGGVKNLVFINIYIWILNMILVERKLIRIIRTQVNLCQKLLFLHQLTHNMTTFMFMELPRKLQGQNMGRTCSTHVLRL